MPTQSSTSAGPTTCGSGHTLVWHNQTPEWFQEWDYTDDRSRRSCGTTSIPSRAGIGTKSTPGTSSTRPPPTTGRCARRCGTTRWAKSTWTTRSSGPAEVTDADLFYNDYGADGINEKSDAIYDLLERLLDRGVPIDGVGLQMHALHEKPDPESVAENIRRFQDLGLDVEITEMDVAYLPEDDPGDEAARQERQAEFYRDIVDVCLETGCDTVVVWGVRDSDSWVPTWFGSSRTTRSCSTTATTRNHPTTRSKKRSRTTDSGGCKPVPASTRTK